MTRLPLLMIRHDYFRSCSLGRVLIPFIVAISNGDDHLCVLFTGIIRRVTRRRC